MLGFLSKLNNPISKEEVAKILSLSPKALEAFEQAYIGSILNSNTMPENFFEVNSRQAVTTMSEDPNGIKDSQLEDIKIRIVNELLSKANIWKFDGKSASTIKVINTSTQQPVTNEEINTLTEHLRPQLTGNLMKIDIDEPSYIILLDYYKRFLTEKEPRKRQLYYHLFRQGLDILDLDDITRLMIATNKNSMGHWLPGITEAALTTGVLKIPKTTIVKIPTTMLQLTRCEFEELTSTTKDIVNEFCRQAFGLDETKDYFIKTGTYSSKFDFRNAYVHEPKEVREIGEYLLFIHYQALRMASSLSTPTIYGVSTTDEWVVREFIHDVEKNPCIYKGLPLHTEYRIFVDFDI